MHDLHWLDQIQPFDRPLVGGEAFRLSSVMQHGYPVVPGFVIPATVARDFLETIQWSNPLLADLPYSSLHLDVDNPRQLQRLAQQLRQEITAAPLPSLWVSQFESAQQHWHTPVLMLRPSLALSVNGKVSGKGELLLSPSGISELLEPHLVSASSVALGKGVKQTWAELFRARSLFYWQSSGISLQQLNLAILVQPVWGATASGTLCASPSRWEIQATWGLFHALRQGEVVPDSYFVQPETGLLQTQKLGIKTRAYRLANSAVLANESLSQLDASCLEAYLLTEEQQKQYALDEKSLRILIEMAQRLVSELGSAFTVEWILSNGENSEPQLYLTQVRTSVVHRHSSVSGTQLTVVNNHSEDVTLTSPPTDVPPHFIQGLAASGGQVLAPAYVLSSSEDWTAVPTGRIIVAKSITPDWLPLLKHAAGIVAEQGGMTSHAAIISRELSIPAVVGAAGVTQLIHTGEAVLVDGDEGKIYQGEGARFARPEPADQETRGQRRRRKTLVQNLLRQSKIHRRASDSPQGNPQSKIHNPQSVDAPAATHRVIHNPQSTIHNFIATQLMVNLSQPSLISRAAALPVDGVGLLRSELMLIEALKGQHPSTWLEQGRYFELLALVTQLISQFAEAFAPRPIFYRSLDLRSHEFQRLERVHHGSSFSPEVNPMLGLRGTFSYLVNPALFDLELAAIAQLYHSGYSNIHLLLPFVRTVEEFTFCRNRVEQAGLSQYPHFQLWIMAEVPSVLFLLPDYVKAGVQGISIGTNDLTQLLLGVDRDQKQMSAAFDERHPAVTRAIAQLIQMARTAGIPCSICGQAPVQHPELIDQLIRWGINSISVEVDAVDRTSVAIVRAEKHLLLEAARHQLQ